MTDGGSTDGPSGWKPVERQRTYEAVLEQIEAQIFAGHLKPGDKLPSERDLSRVLGVSRSSVREAIRVLEALDIVSVRPGSGADSGSVLVHDPGGGIANLLRLQVGLSLFTMDEIVDARVVLEEWTASAAAKHADPDDLTAMREILEQMNRAALSAEEFQRLDADFHVAIGRASGSPLMFTFLQGLREAVRIKLSERMEGMPDPSGTMSRLYEEHTAIYEAIEAGEAADAARLVVDHIRRFYSTSSASNVTDAAAPHEDDVPA